MDTFMVLYLCDNVSLLFLLCSDSALLKPWINKDIQKQVHPIRSVCSPAIF